jgi:tRNA A37 threonylcarbamoyladenosine modification protein TsaB
MAKNIGRGVVCPVMDARRDQFYTAIFKDGVRLLDDCALSVEEIKAKLSDYPDVTVCGDGMEKLLSLCGDCGNLFPASFS